MLGKRLRPRLQSTPALVDPMESAAILVNVNVNTSASHPHSRRRSHLSIQNTEATLGVDSDNEDILNVNKKVKLEEFHVMYELLHVIGKGKNAVVHLARNRTTNKFAAVKVINQTFLRNQRQMHCMVQTEISVFQHIQSSMEKNTNLGAMIQMYEEAGAIYLVLEYYSGGELFDHVVTRGTYSEKDASVLIKQLVKGTQALHNVSVIHRDIKPENIVFETPDDFSEIKLIDFGHCKLPETTKTGSGSTSLDLVGTPGYIAPEVITQRSYTTACDVWSIGVILYILLSGYPPFYAMRNDALFEMIKKGSYSFHEKYWKNISDEAKDLVRRMLTVDPSRRITVEEILRHPWIAQNNRTEHMADTIKRLGTFNAKRKLRAAALACVWGVGKFGRRNKLAKVVGKKQLSDEELHNILNLFRKHATDDGIDFDSFTLIMQQFGFNMHHIRRMFQLFDSDGDNKIDYKEFLMGIGTLSDDDESTLKFCFDLFDTDESGAISRDELWSVYNHIADSTNEDENDKAERLAGLFEKLDANNDNEISFEEFRAGMKSDPQLVQAFTRPLVRSMASSPAGSPCSTPSSSLSTSFTSPPGASSL